VNETDIKTHVGAKIKKYRQKNKLTQFQLGELIDINQRQVAQLECGKSFPSLSTLIKLSKVFNLNISDLFYNEADLNETELKEFLKAKIDSAGYDDCKRVYTVIKTFMNI